MKPDEKANVPVISGIRSFFLTNLSGKAAQDEERLDKRNQKRNAIVLDKPNVEENAFKKFDPELGNVRGLKGFFPFFGPTAIRSASGSKRKGILGNV